MQPSPSSSLDDDLALVLADTQRAASGIDSRELLRVLSAQRWLIAVGTALVVAAAALYSFTATPYYRAQLRVLIECDSEQVVSFQEIYNLGTANDDYYVTQYRILESRAIAEAALALLPPDDRRWFEAHDDPPQRLLQLSRISPVAKSRLVDIEAEHPDPEVAARMAQALVDAYVADVQARRSTASGSALDKLRAEAKSLQAALIEAEQATQQFKERHKIISMNDRQSLVAARLEKLSNELADVERERREAEARLARTDQAVAADATFSPDLPEVLESRVIGDHKRELLAAREERSALLQRYKTKHPRLQAVERRIHAIESQIATEVEAIYRGVRQHAERLTRHQADVSARLAAQTDELLALERASIQYEILKNEADNIRRTHDAIVARLKEVEVINDHQASNVHALGAPEVSKAPVRPRIALNLALALLLGLLASAGAAFAADALDSSIKTPADAARILGLPILGLVPRLEGKRPARAAADPETFDSRSTLSEAFRTIRTNFTFSEAGRDVRSLVVTSATPEEGKSLVSLNLAVSMGRAGKRVLLVDADLRRPRLHRAFEVTAEEGLSSVLVGARQLDELVLPTRADNVWLLPCGLIPPNPVELLASEHMPECLRAALRRFDLVLIDSPPVGVVSDACVLATQADRVVFVVRSFKAHRGLCRRAAAQLAAVGARIAGCVVNHCDVRADRYGQYDYEYSYLSRYDYAERGAAPADAAAP